MCTLQRTLDCTLYRAVAQGAGVSSVRMTKAVQVQNTSRIRLRWLNVDLVTSSWKTTEVDAIAATTGSDLAAKE